MFNFVLILVLINAIKCQGHLQENPDLNGAIKQTTDFFEKLKMDYAIKRQNKDIMSAINNKVEEHVENKTKAIFVRHKRELSEDSNKDINILDGFQDFTKYNFNDARDVNFFSLQNKLQTIWFAVILNISKVSVFQIYNSDLHPIRSFPLTNGTQVIVNSCAYGALLVVQHQKGSILVLRFTKVKDSYLLDPLQEFEPNNITHLTVWQGMNQLYLGVASHLSISIFTWFDDYFDLVQVINLGTKKLVPFYSKGFMYLAATGSATFIFKYFLKSNEFVVIQRLPSSQDVSFFQLREGHFMEHFLSFSTESFVIIYKEIHDRFIPFQQISRGRSTVPVISNKTMLILSLFEDIVMTYQYDGWRLIELNIKLSGVQHLRQVILHEKELLLIKYKNDTWMLKQPTWSKKKSYKNLQGEIKAWIINAKKAAQKALDEIPDLKNSLTISGGHIDQLFVHKVNEHNSQTLANLSKEYKNVLSKLQEQKVIMKTKLRLESLTLTSLHAKEMKIKCRTKCKITRLNVKGKTNLFAKLEISKTPNQIRSFKILSVNEIMKWKCPLLNLPVKNIIVNKSINGISLDDLQENVLKVTDNQEVSGKHGFLSINVTNAFISLNIASNLTKQAMQVQEIKVKELNLTEGGLLLSLNGSMTTITGSIKASKVKVKGIINLQGKLKGSRLHQLSPIVSIPEFMSLDGDIMLENAKIENLRSTDLIGNKIGSIKDILSNAIALWDNIPVPVILSSERMKWNNVTLHSPQKWITENSQSTVTISGKKHIFHNVQIAESSRENFKFPKIEIPLCGAIVIAPKITISVVETNNMDVKRLKCFHIFGNLGEEYGTSNTTLFFKSSNLPTERLHQNVIAEKISIIHLNDTDLKGLKRLANSWIEPNILKISIEATNLIVNILQLPVQFRINLPKVIRNMISQQNTYVDNINNINFDDFLDNTIKLEDMISLEHVIFGNGFAANHTYTSHLPLHLRPLEENLNLYKKQISGNMKTKVMHLPYTFGFTESEAPFNIIIQGSAIFLTEPTVQNMNRIKLDELVTKIWMITNTTVFTGKKLHITNALMEGNVTVNGSLSSLHLKMWKNISNRLLSKTRSQEIISFASFNNVETSIIIGSNISTIKSVISNLNDMFDNALARNKEQEVKAKWTFNKLKVLGKLNTKKRVNHMNLKTDVMRHDAEENIVIGKKTVVILTTQNLNGLNFDKWFGNTFMQKDELIIIKGQKNFNTVTFRNINVSGSIMGCNIEKALSKSIDQTIFGQKTIQGSVNVSALVIDGFVNDVNLTDLMIHQLKKEKPSQKIKTGIALQNTLKIVGNLTINGSYARAELKNFYMSYSNIEPSTEKMKKYLIAAKAINVALGNRAAYIDKLELVKISNTIDTFFKNITLPEKHCEIRNSSQLCANEHIRNFVLKPNLTDYVLIKSILLGEDEFIVWIKFDSVSIYKYNDMEKSLSHLKDLHIPRIINAFVESTSHSLWIVLRLTSQTLVLRYQPWKDLEEYILPSTDVFTVSWAPNDQLLLLLSDGVWNLEGLASPQNILKISLKDKMETFTNGPNYYIKCMFRNITTLMKARYIGN